MRVIDEIIWHCTATPEGRHVTVEEVTHWHTAPPPEGNGWNAIGYQLLTYIDGSPHAGRPESEAGAHTAGHNANSLGYCYVGGLDADGAPKDTRTDAQKATMERVTREAIQRYPTITKISGHYEYANKACPCFNPGAEYAHLLIPTQTITLADRPAIEAFKFPSHNQFVRAFDGGMVLPLRAENSDGLFTNPAGGEQRWFCVVVEGQEMWIQEHDIT